MSDLFEILDSAPSVIIADSFVITKSKLERYENIMVSISGGADSDIMLDLVNRLQNGQNIRYVFFDTGLEYAATKEHLKYLEQKYGVQIEIEKAVKPIPLSCRQYGQPFVSKTVSEFISRLQRHNFKWEDRPFEELLKEYPRCKSALKWWCNMKDKKKDGSESSFNISHNKWLKEFIIANPPDFKISNKCCKYAKKEVATNYKKRHGIDLSMTGVRKAEGGARAFAYKSCFSSNEDDADEFRPIFWYKNGDKEEYEAAYEVTHSKCYSCYGLRRTGCAGCPFGQNFEQELAVIEKHDPKLYKAVNNIFDKSYEYTRKYREFASMKEEEEAKQ